MNQGGWQNATPLYRLCLISPINFTRQISTLVALAITPSLPHLHLEGSLLTSLAFIPLPLQRSKLKMAQQPMVVRTLYLQSNHSCLKTQRKPTMASLLAALETHLLLTQTRLSPLRALLDTVFSMFLHSFKKTVVIKIIFIS